MDLSDPTLSVTATLDGPVLVALVHAGRPLTVSEVAKASARGSEIGIRRSLSRLVSQGVVTSTEFGNTRVYHLNREHVAAGAAIELSRLRTLVWQRTAREVERWSVRPLYASVFGSAARQEGDTNSDIDLLLVRPSTRSELEEAQEHKTVVAALGMWLDVIMTRGMADTSVTKWDSNVDQLHGLMRRWTGNALQVVTVSAVEWSQHRQTKSAIYQSIRQDEIRLYDEFSPVTYRYPKGKAD